MTPDEFKKKHAALIAAQQKADETRRGTPAQITDETVAQKLPGLAASTIKPAAEDAAAVLDALIVPWETKLNEPIRTIDGALASNAIRNAPRRDSALTLSFGLPPKREGTHFTGHAHIVFVHRVGQVTVSMYATNPSSGRYESRGELTLENITHERVKAEVINTIDWILGERP